MRESERHRLLDVAGCARGGCSRRRGLDLRLRPGDEFRVDRGRLNSPTKRSLAKLRAEGWLVAVVERWNPYAKVRQDLFGFIDLLAIRGDETLAVQTTSGAHVAERFEKIRNTDAGHAARLWLASPNRKIVIHGWRKVGPRGKRKTWECRELPVIRSDIQLAQLALTP